MNVLATHVEQCHSSSEDSWCCDKYLKKQLLRRRDLFGPIILVCSVENQWNLLCETLYVSGSEVLTSLRQDNSINILYPGRA